MDLPSLERALSALPLGPLRFFESIGSTNEEAARWAKSGAPDLSLVVADEQTAGRGRLERRWFTPPQSALAFSLVLRPGEAWPEWETPHASLAPRLSALGALAVCDALMELELRAEIKWPNDVLIERRKVCGILSEVHWEGDHLQGAVLGIGVNITPGAIPPPEKLAFPATSIEIALGRPVDRLAVLRSILAHLLQWRKNLPGSDFLHAWEERLAFRGEWVQLQPLQTEALALEGQVQGLESDGALRLLDRSGHLFAIHAGEIRLRPANAERE